MRTSLVLSSLISIFISLTIWAQKKDFGLPPTDLRPGSLHQGDLFTLKMVPGDKETSFFVVGKKVGAIKIDKMKIDLVFESGGETRRLNLNRRDQAFVLPQKVDKDINLELKGESPGEVDKVHVKVKP